MAGLLLAVMFVLMYADAIASVSRHGITVDIPRVFHAISMPRANREDALLIAVFRDGSVYFGTDKLLSEELPSKISEKLSYGSVERKIYIKADARAKYGGVEGVLDAIRLAGIGKIAFLAYERKPITLSH
jgi:biopolymer transport protein ExbD/biopolymer transport protein TolR